MDDPNVKMYLMMNAETLSALGSGMLPAPQHVVASLLQVRRVVTQGLSFGEMK
jgi:hypothetical protein